MRWRRQPRSRLTALADRLVVPRPFQLEEFCAGIARERGRPLRLVALANAAGADLPCGLWVGLDSADLIFYEAGAAPILKAQIVLHEVSHMLLGHVSPEGTSVAEFAELVDQLRLAERAEAEAAARAERAAAVDRAARDAELGLVTDRVLALLARSGYSSCQEADAESLATLILERATRAANRPANRAATRC